MTYRRQIRLYRQAPQGDWQSPLMVALEMDRSARARRGQHVPPDRHDLLARLRAAGAFARTARRSGLAALLLFLRCRRRPSPSSASSGATSCSPLHGCLPLCSHGPSRPASASASADAAIALGLCAWHPASAQCAVRGSDSCDYILWPMAFRLKRAALVYIPGGHRLLRARAARLLRRARCEEGTSAAFDVRVRPRRHQPFRQVEPVSGDLRAGTKTRCCSTAATSRPCGTSTGGATPANS